MEHQLIKLKIAVLGKSLVGKSAMTNVFVCSKFLEEYDTTIEDKYTVEKYISEKPCSIDILDTAGQDDYASLIDTWINSSDVISISPILSPCEILSPTLTLIFLILPEN